jgi:hypothetical protein
MQIKHKKYLKMKLRMPKIINDDEDRETNLKVYCTIKNMYDKSFEVYRNEFKEDIKLLDILRSKFLHDLKKELNL